MKEIVILSGKGGTGKTTIVGSLAALAESKVLADCDVDAADLYLLLNPSDKQQSEFWSGQVAHIDEDRCTECGLCQELCRFKAIKDFRVDLVSCEGCGFCAHICPTEAITMKENLSGKWFISETKYGPLVHARLGIAQENSGKLVTQVRQKAREIAEREGREWLIMDGSPGIGCPVIASLSGTDLALIVTEPTPSGVHDMERIAELAAHFKIRTVCAINKFDLNPANSGRIESWCREKGIPVTGKIPFDDEVMASVVRGLPLVEYSRGPAAESLKEIWRAVSSFSS